jgi:IS605 OrfB family transposase
VVGLAVGLGQLAAEVGAARPHDLLGAIRWAVVNTGWRYFVTNIQVGAKQKDAVATFTDVLMESPQPSMVVGMRLRYRYRLDPTPAQRQALARGFGCARVVYNDGLRLREDAYRAGLPYVSGGELSRRVITLAKQTPERAWLGEVPAVVLQQSLADLDRAYRNYFRALAEVKAARARGQKAKLGVRKPRYKARRHDQAIRFTANARFHLLPNGRLRLPKVGDLRIRWSRPLPGEPSSVTVTQDCSGRYHVSFVVEVARQPLPATNATVGIDLGLTSFAVLSTGEKVANPRWLGQRQKALRRSQRNMSRKQNGSKNREKARCRVARLHAKVADARADFHHQLSARLIRDNHVLFVEDLNVAGLGRSKLAKSITDAGWGQFTVMLAYKADLYGRTLVKVDRFHPSSQLCSGCGAQAGPKGRDGLKVRAWTCSACGTHHDRDINAAKNILAAGLAVAACGPGVRPGARRAVGNEAGTTLAGAA